MKAYEAYVSATSDDEKIRKLEEYLSLIPKHKGTEKERGNLRRKLAQMRESLEKKARGGGRKDNDLSVKKEGAVQVVLAGFPNAGKSSLLCETTNAEVKVANYAFTTLKPNIGMIPINNVNIQLVDLPGLISGAAKDKGMGKRFLSVMRNSDIVAFVLAVNDKPLEKLDFLLREFDIAGIRLNKTKPDVKVYKKESGGINILGKHMLTFELQDAIESLREFSIINADVRINRRMGYEDFIDAIDKSVVWKKAIVIVTKTDLVGPSGVKKVEQEVKKRFAMPVIAVSNTEKTNLKELVEEIWETAGLMCIYTTTNPNKEPLVVPKGESVIEVAARIHSDFVRKFKYARVWGKSAKYPGQRVGKEHVLEDRDVIELHAE